MRASSSAGRVAPALIVILAGVSAALQVGKLPPALPVLRDALGVTLMQAGFLLSLMQLAGMTLGVVAGLAADQWGARRTMLAGLAILVIAGAWGGFAHDATSLLVLRAVEGLGFLLATLPAPGLIRRLVAPAQMNAMLGLWGAYMPLGTALALLFGPWIMQHVGWPGWWWTLAAVSLWMLGWVALRIPADPPAKPGGQSASGGGLLRLRQTLGSRGPWLVALTFSVYSGQWLAVVGFLPSIYQQAGIAGGLVAWLTALAAGANMVGNIASGRLMQRGVAPQHLLWTGFAAMALGSVLAFAALPGVETAPWLRYGAVLLFSAVGGVIPGTLFSLAVRLAPGEGTISTTVGWMQQLSSLGQFLGPPAAAWLAVLSGGWQWTWVLTVSCALAGVGLTALTARQLRIHAAGQGRPSL